MTLVTRSIPPDDKGYSGLIAHDLGNGREVVVMGHGPEAEKALRDFIQSEREE
jgi:phosphotransferase system HPr-like phosphotransfer protein